jgi:polysaccharide pyruvyl transferase WcaK-like protein
VTASRDRRTRPAAAPAVGIFGGFGGGNIGNDASMEAVLSYLRNDQPDAVVDVMTSHPDVVKDRYGIAAVGMGWQRAQASGSAAIVMKALGRGIDTLRIASWVRRHDVVIVPGMGVLETTLPMRPWGFPYTMFAMSLSGRVFRTKVALVSVGSNVIRQPLTRRLFTSAARLASYRSYRDTLSLDAMRRNGADVRSDHVYIDLAFSIPVPPADPGDARTVGIGVMDFHGTNDDDRSQADSIRASYLEKITTFARWLVDHDYKIRLLVGDTNGSDDTVVQEITADLRAYRPDLDHEALAAEPVSTFADLMRAMAPAGTIIATRYHNLICALMLSKPTLSVGYGVKNAVLMEDMGLAEYSQLVSSFDVDQLIKQFTDLESQAAKVRQVITERNAEYRERVERQFAELSSVLFR